MAQGDLTKLEGHLHTAVTSARRRSRPGRYGRTEWPCTQNTAGDLSFDCADDGKVHIYASEISYDVDYLSWESQSKYHYYIGTLNF